MIVDIVLGLQFGDEGKGTTVDYLCDEGIKNDTNPVVIRFSGGPQAGHTVRVDEEKHIHSSFGSGTLRHNTPTYFTEHTLVYPVNIYIEMLSLNEKGINPDLTIHPLATLIMPIDVTENRDSNRDKINGTCGKGIGKAMKRQNNTPFKFYAIDMLNVTLLKQKFQSYLRNIGSSVLSDDEKREVEAFFSSIINMKWNIKDYSYLRSFDHYIFEGSQGIMLDMDHGVFPYVTYANTTSKNAFDIIEKMRKLNELIGEINTYYVTRAYATRHGNGPFKEFDMNLINNEDEINVDNKYQGQFKIGKLDIESINSALLFDVLYSKTTFKHIVVTCLDQMPKEYKFPYGELNHVFSTHYESFSSDSKDFKRNITTHSLEHLLQQ